MARRIKRKPQAACANNATDASSGRRLEQSFRQKMRKLDFPDIRISVAETTPRTKSFGLFHGRDFESKEIKFQNSLYPNNQNRLYSQNVK
jgi:hypothetical protein